MGFAESFLKARALKLATQKQKQQEKLTNLQIEEAMVRLGAASERAKAKQRLLQPDSRPTVQTPEGPPRPEETGVLARIAQGQTDTISDMVRSGLTDEFKKIQGLQGFRTQEETLANIQGSGLLEGQQGGPGFTRRSTTINPVTGSLSIQSQQIGPVIRELGDNTIALFDPNSGEMLKRIEKSTPQSEQNKQQRQFIPEGELQNIVFIDKKNFSVRPPPFNLRRGQLNDKDFVRVDAAKKKQLNALQNALGMLDQLERTVDPVFTAQAGLLERGASGAQQAWEQILQSNPALTLYSSQSQGLVSRFARALGEVGTLTDQDAARALKLLPRLRNRLGLPDTADVAAAKIEAFRTLLQTQYNQILGKKVFDLETPVLDRLIKDAPDDGVIEQGKKAIGEAERGISSKAKSAADSVFESLKKRFGLQDSQ